MDGYDLSRIPAETPPLGVEPNFVNPPSQEQLPKIFTYVTLPLMVLFLALRVYVRTTHARLELDDYLCILAAASIVVHIALCFVVIDQAAGPHMWDIPLSKITASYAQNTTVLANIYLVSALFIKEAILVLYRRIFKPSHLANVLLWVGIVFTAVFYIAIIIVFLATGLPRSEDYATGGWLSPAFASRSYAYSGYVTATTGVVGSVIDIYILLIPLAFLWGLNTSVKRKAGLSAIFLTGSSACVFSIVGAVFRLRIATPNGNDQDLSWNTMPIYAMNIAEVNIGIVSSCMPIIFILFKRVGNWSTSLLTKLRELTSKHSESNSRSNANDIDVVEYRGMHEKQLPKPSFAELTGLRSLILNMHRTRQNESTSTSTTSELQTFQSVDYSYHAQLKYELGTPGSRGQT